MYPDIKKQRLDLITKQDLVESEQFTVSPLIFRGLKRPIQIKIEQWLQWSKPESVDPTGWWGYG